jgi:hypothetical protein
MSFSIGLFLYETCLIRGRCCGGALKMGETRVLVECGFEGVAVRTHMAPRFLDATEGESEKANHRKKKRHQPVLRQAHPPPSPLFSNALLPTLSF